MNASSLLVLMVACLVIVHSSPTQRSAVCTYGGQNYTQGELVTGNPCDRCRCFNDNLMCELIGCPQLTCTSRVMGECCEECAPERQCIHQLPTGRTEVPETGCMYTDAFGDVVCFCHHGATGGDSPVYCLPAFFMDATPSCVIKP